MWLVERTGVDVAGLPQILWRTTSDFGVTEFSSMDMRFIVELRNTITRELKVFESSPDILDILHEYNPYGLFGIETLDGDTMHVFVSVDAASYEFLGVVDHIEFVSSSLVLRSLGIVVSNYTYAYDAVDEEMSIVERQYVDIDEGHDYRTLFRALVDEPNVMWGSRSVYLPQFYDDGTVQSALKVVFNDVVKAKRMLTKGVVLSK